MATGAYRGLDYFGIDGLYTEEERAVRDTVRDFVSARVLPGIGKHFTAGTFPHDLVPVFGELGLLGASLTGYGCPGISPVGYGLICQELERGDSGIRSFCSVQSSLVMYPIWAYGSEAQKARYLPAMARGQLVGCFGLTEPDFGSNPTGMLTTARKVDGGYVLNGTKRWITSGSVAMTAQDWARSWKPWLRGTAIGFPIGAMPAGGADIASFLSYGTERKLTRHPEEFGNGAIEGVAGPEAANNAAAAGTLVPLLTLGLPTTATAAIMLAGFQQFGLQPGPLLFATAPKLVWGLIASLLIANIMLLVLNLPLIRLWVKLLTIPRPWLYGGILLFATLGTIGVNPSRAELAMLMIFGVMGYLMRLHGYPIAPVVVGLILGPMAEQQLRRALAIAQGDWTTLVSTPLSAGLIGLAVLALAVPMLLRMRGRGAVLAQVAKDDD